MKLHRRYLAYGVFAVIVVLGWNAVALVLMQTRGSSMVVISLFPLMLPAPFMSFSLGAFPFRYSIFGALERTEFPQEPPIYGGGTSRVHSSPEVRSPIVFDDSRVREAIELIWQHKSATLAR